MLELLFSNMGMLRNRFRDTIQLHRLIQEPTPYQNRDSQLYVPNPSSVGLMENNAMYINFNIVNSSGFTNRVYYSPTPFTLENLPDTYVEIPSASNGVTLPDGLGIEYLMAQLRQVSSGAVVLNGKITRISEMDFDIKHLIPNGVNIVSYFNADNATTTRATIEYLGNILSIPYTTQAGANQTLTVATYEDQRYIVPNGSSIIKFPTAFETNQAVTLLVKFVPPTRLSGVSYNLSAPFTASYVSGYDADTMFGYGVNGNTIFVDRNGVGYVYYANDQLEVVANRKPTTNFYYSPIDVAKEDFIMGTLGRYEKVFKPAYPNVHRNRLEGLFGGLRGSMFGDGGAIRSMLLLEGKMTLDQIRLLAMVMESD